MADKQYRTIQGDMWDAIASKTLGGEHRMSDLIDANPAHRETVIFPAGVVLKIPTDVPADDLLHNLPPWKRG